MSNSEKAPIPTIGEKAGIGLTFTKVLLAALTRLAISPFKRSTGARTYYRDITYTAIRTQLRNMNISQMRYLSPTTTVSYHLAAKTLGFQPSSIDLPNGVQAHWLGDKDASLTLVYFHGGGYVQPAGPHFAYLCSMLKELNEHEGMGGGRAKISALVLAYTLAPDAEYPTQLSEAATLIDHLLKSGRAPSSLLLAGDSAGANLVLSLLSHILHPHPNANAVEAKIPILTLSEPLRAIFLISPWVSFSPLTHPSNTTNAETDIFDSAPLKLWSNAFLGSTKRHGILLGDSYSEPLIAEPTWWSGAHEVVNEVLIWGGGGEILIDSIRAFGDKFVEGWVGGGGEGGKVTRIEGVGMAHEEQILDVLLGFKEKGAGAVEIEEWVKAKL
ncbi:alpha/beta-hydrolase [Tothia fuscella]|uniref:Alpha/beta-hydrolase n=1 Tax=Tothia fuscella TaxID=1048955 RepID=A0A9P4TUB4_9PEZI|nr:alpha/beta-hydrolase [Tothia fuscella]